jgi:hypothetical protein
MSIVEFIYWSRRRSCFEGNLVVVIVVVIWGNYLLIYFGIVITLFFKN